MRKSVFTLWVLFFSLHLLTSTGFCYDSQRAARHIFTAFDGDYGKGMAVGEVYRLHSKEASFTKYDVLAEETINGVKWSIEAEILSMENAGAGLFFIYSDSKGIGTEITKGGKLSFKYLEVGRNGNFITWSIAEKKLSEIHIPFRLGISYNINTTDFSVLIDGESILAGKTSTSSFSPLFIAFDNVGIKVINDILNQPGYCDFGSITLKVE